VGVSTFLENLGVAFVFGLDVDDIPTHIDLNDRSALSGWLHEAFAMWLLDRRDQVMAGE
jgi:isopentenyldiphosphate isomerase